MEAKSTNTQLRNMGFMVMYAILVACYLSTDAKQIPKMGPYRFIMRERAKCFDYGTKEVGFRDVSMRKINRTTFELIGTIISNVTLDDSVELRFNYAIWGNGGWKQNGLTYVQKKMCTVIRTLYKSWWDELIPFFREQLNVTDCPIPAPLSVTAKTTIDSNRFTMTRSLIPQLPYGRYLTEAGYVYDGQIRGCMAGVVDIVPMD